MFDEWSDKWISIAKLFELPSMVINSIGVITSQQPQSNKSALNKVIEWWFSESANPEMSTVQKVLLNGGLYALKCMVIG